MKIKSLHIRNFYSIENIFLDFSNKSGIICIEGKNKDNANCSNGVGKSSIYEAIIWALFGKTIRKSNEEALVNNKAKKDCGVTIELSNGTVIKRTRRPTFLSYKVNGKDLTKESVNSTQELIEENLGLNYKTFLTAYIFGQQNELDFVSSTIEDKRIIIRNFLNLEDIFNLREKIKKLKSDINANIKANQTLIEDYTTQISKVNLTQFNLEKEIKDIKEKYNIVKNCKLEDILKLEAEKVELTDKIKLYYKSIDEYKTGVEKWRAKIVEKENKCDYCGSVLGHLALNHEEECTKNIEFFKNQIKSLNEKIPILTEQLQNIKIPIPSTEYNKIEQINILNSKFESNEEFKIKNQEKLNSIIQEKNDFNKKLEILKFWEVVFSEQGIIKYVIRSILDYFNNRCAYYLSYLTSGKYSILFDDSLQETIVVNGVEVNYNSLSGGEKKKINFAVLLALQSILDFSTKGQVDLLLLDEVVESIDDESINGFYNLLLELSKDKLILIITHNSTLKDFLIDKPKINLVKKNGITKHI